MHEHDSDSASAVSLHIPISHPKPTQYTGIGQQLLFHTCIRKFDKSKRLHWISFPSVANIINISLWFPECGGPPLNPKPNQRKMSAIQRKTFTKEEVISFSLTTTTHSSYCYQCRLTIFMNHPLRFILMPYLYLKQSMTIILYTCHIPIMHTTQRSHGSSPLNLHMKRRKNTNKTH